MTPDLTLPAIRARAEADSGRIERLRDVARSAADTLAMCALVPGDDEAVEYAASDRRALLDHIARLEVERDELAAALHVRGRQLDAAEERAATERAASEEAARADLAAWQAIKATWEAERDELLASARALEARLATDRGTPHRCPICNGDGSVWMLSSAVQIPCPTCKGARVLWSAP